MMGRTRICRRWGRVDCRHVLTIAPRKRSSPFEKASSVATNLRVITSGLGVGSPSSIGSKGRTCNCKNSKCLKLYCELGPNPHPPDVVGDDAPASSLSASMRTVAPLARTQKDEEACISSWSHTTHLREALWRWVAFVIAFAFFGTAHLSDPRLHSQRTPLTSSFRETQANASREVLSATPAASV